MAVDTTSDTSSEYASILGAKPEKYNTKVLLFQIRNIKRLHWLEWLFLLLAVVSILGTLGITIERIVDITRDNHSSCSHNSGDDWKSDPDFTFAVLLIVNLVFCAVYAVDGLLREQKYEMLTYVGGVLVIMIYIITNYIDKGKEDCDIRLVRLILMCAAAPPNIIIALLVFYRMGFLEMNYVGANTTLLKIYRTGVEFCTLLKFNFQIAASCLVIVLCRPSSETPISLKVILSVGLVLVALWTVLGWILVYKENSLLAVVFIMLSSTEVAFYLYVLIVTAIKHRHFHHELVAIAIYSLGSLGIINFILIIIWFFRAVINFGAGMKEKILP